MLDADLPSKARGIIFCMSLHLHPCFVSASSEGSGKSVHMHLPELSLLDNAISTKMECPYVALLVLSYNIVWPT